MTPSEKEIRHATLVQASDDFGAVNLISPAARVPAACAPAARTSAASSQSDGHILRTTSNREEEREGTQRRERGRPQRQVSEGGNNEMFQEFLQKTSLSYS